MIRITGGAARSIQLKTLPIDTLRPATDQMRQSVFNSLGERVPGARFLDLFAGSGAYGLEAFSRGAASGTFVEKDPKLAKIIEENLQKVAKSAKRDPKDCKISCADILRWQLAASEAETYQLVFADPPYALYEKSNDTFVKITALAATALASGGLLLLEHPAGLSFPAIDNFTFVKNLGGRSPQSPNIGMWERK